MIILNWLTEADDYFTRALKANPAYVPALLGRARTLHHLHQPGPAMHDAEKALGLEGQSETAHALLLQIYLSLNLEQKAKAIAEWLDEHNRSLLTGEAGRK